MRTGTSRRALRDFVSSASESDTSATSSLDENLLKLAQTLYEQIAANGKSSSASTLETTA